MVAADSGRSPGRGAIGEFHTVTDPLQARLLTDGAVQEFFRPFLARDVTASEAAAELDCGLDAVLYRIKTFLAAGLLHVVRELPRKGRPIKVYRSVHDAYFIPYEVTPFATLEERLLRQMTVEFRERASIQARRMLRSGWLGQRLYRNELGETWSDAARDPDSDWLAQGREIAIDFWTDLQLTDDEATALRATLYEALKRYEGRGGNGETTPEGTRPYRFSSALLPLEE